MKVQQIILAIGLFTLFACTLKQSTQLIIINETGDTESIEQVIEIDSVWAGHPVGFCLYTHGNRQYIAYYNANRNLVVGQKNLDDENFELYIMPPTRRETAGGTSTVLGWDSHNYVTIGIDKDGFIHLSGNMHVHPITYFKSKHANDISTLVQEMELIGSKEGINDGYENSRFCSSKLMIPLPKSISKILCNHFAGNPGVGHCDK
jgi:hypothetical protein